MYKRPYTYCLNIACVSIYVFAYFHVRVAIILQYQVGTIHTYSDYVTDSWHKTVHYNLFTENNIWMVFEVEHVLWCALA